MTQLLFDLDLMHEYEIFEHLGKGAYGTVHKARNKTTKETLAVKMIEFEEGQDTPKTAIREASLLQKLDHENIIRLRDVVLSENKLYLFLDLMEMNLGTYIYSCPTFFKDPHLIKTFIFQILHGIEYCHSHSVLHRDLKPQNLLINKNTEALKLADFGLGRVFSIPVKKLSPECLGHAKRGHMAWSDFDVLYQ